MLVGYRCPSCRIEHKRAFVTKTREYPCAKCSTPVTQAAIPPRPPVVAR